MSWTQACFDKGTKNCCLTVVASWPYVSAKDLAVSIPKAEYLECGKRRDTDEPQIRGGKGTIAYVSVW
jgi:hypothetical protein